MLSHYAVFVVATAYHQKAFAFPQVKFPLAAQLPPVGVVEKDFSFGISTETFWSNQNLTYQLNSAASWLRFNSEAFTLFGKPTKTDLGLAHVQVVASDEEGSVTFFTFEDFGVGVDS